LRQDAYWMGEAQSRVVVTCDAAAVSAVEVLAATFGVKTTSIGKVTKSDVVVNNENWGSILNWKNDYDTAIEKKLA